MKTLQMPLMKERIRFAWRMYTGADGSLIDLKKIIVKAKKFGAKVVIDGTQSVGALPFSLEEYKVDALICAAYKWMLGPYGTALAYYGPAYDQGLLIRRKLDKQERQ